MIHIVAIGRLATSWPISTNGKQFASLRCRAGRVFENRPARRSGDWCDPQTAVKGINQYNIDRARGQAINIVGLMLIAVSLIYDDSHASCLKNTWFEITDKTRVQQKYQHQCLRVIVNTLQSLIQR